MSPKHARMRFCAAAIVALLGQAAQAETSDSFLYTKVQPGTLTLPAAAFTPERNDYAFTNPGGFLHTLNPGVNCFHAPIQLPQRATLNSAGLMYSSTAAGSMTFKILRNFGGGEQIALVDAVPAATSGDVIENYYATGEHIDNRYYSYFARVCMSQTDAVLYGIQLQFGYRSAGD
jgi:hypothetical protein